MLKGANSARCDVGEALKGSVWIAFIPELFGLLKLAFRDENPFRGGMVMVRVFQILNFPDLGHRIEGLFLGYHRIKRS